MTGAELNEWRKRMKLSLTDAAKALGISRGRLTDCLYMPLRPPSRAVVATAQLIEERAQRGGGRP